MSESTQKVDSLAALNAQIATQRALVNSSRMNPITATPPQGSIPWWTTRDAMTVSAAVLVFGFFMSCIVAILLLRGKSADDVLKGIGTIMIILAALFLVVAGYDDKQIAPVIGLLGTIAGYILGRSSRLP